MVVSFYIEKEEPCMKVISPSFKDDTDKIIVLAMLILSIFLICIPALVVMLLFKNQLTENSYEITKAIFNMELLMFLISLLFFIPVFGFLLSLFLGPVMLIINTVVIVLVLCNIAKDKDVKIPVAYDFI